jgi:hypothetical protein
MHSYYESFYKAILDLNVFDPNRVIPELRALSPQRYPLAHYVADTLESDILSKRIKPRDGSMRKKAFSNLAKAPGFILLKTAFKSKNLFSIVSGKIPFELINSIVPNVERHNYEEVLTKLGSYNYSGIPALEFINRADEVSIREFITDYDKKFPIRKAIVLPTLEEIKAVANGGPVVISMPVVKTKTIGDLLKPEKAAQAEVTVANPSPPLQKVERATRRVVTELQLPAGMEAAPVVTSSAQL